MYNILAKGVTFFEPYNHKTIKLLYFYYDAET